MSDQRILDLERAALEMSRGHFDAPVPGGNGDDLSRLAEALRCLGKALEKRFAEIQALAEVTEKINSGYLLDEVLEQVYQSFRPFLPYDRIGFSLIDPERGEARARWARSEAAAMHLTTGFSAPLKGSSLEAVLATKQPRIINDLELYLREHPSSKSTRLIVAEGMRSNLTCPLLVMGKPVGFMFFSSMRPAAYRDAHVAMFQEIAGQLSLIVEKSRLYQRLLELDRLKNRFLGMAAHDLRGPIGRVLLAAETLLDGIHGPLTAGQAEVLREMAAGAEGMRILVDDLLDVSAIEAGLVTLRPRPVDPASLLRQCLKGQRLAAQKRGISLEEALSPALPASLSLDPDRLRQVLDNLLGNALKFSPTGTRVILSASADQEAVTVSVTDQGPGLSASEIDGLFQPFGRGTVKPAGGEKSTGLGLAIAKRLVEAQGGRLWAESIPGEGSTFRFTLPRNGDQRP